MELSNREIAYAILLGLLILLLVVFPRSRAIVCKAASSVSSSIFVIKLLLPLASYFLYAGLIAFVSYRLGFWNISLAKETVYVVLFVGLPALFSAVGSKNRTKLFRRVVGGTLGVSALLGFYVGLEPLPLWGELLLLPFLTFCVLMSTFAKTRSGQEKKIGTCFEVLTAIAGGGLIVFTTIQVIGKFGDYEWDAVLDSFSLSVWFAIALLPFIYVFVFIANCESALVVLSSFNNGQIPKLRTRIGFVIGLHFSTRFSRLFIGKWRRELALSETFKDSLGVMKKFRSEVRRRAKAETSRLKVLKQNAGIRGTDSEGTAIDRREFFETKQALRELSTYQMAARRKTGKYRPDLLEIFDTSLDKNLPKDHGVQLRLNDDQAAWRAWRCTPGGWYFGVGGTVKDEEWCYFDSEAPASFPMTNQPNWFNDAYDQLSKEWEKGDGPIRPS